MTQTWPFLTKREARAKRIAADLETCRLKCLEEFANPSNLKEGYDP